MSQNPPFNPGRGDVKISLCYSKSLICVDIGLLSTSPIHRELMGSQSKNIRLPQTHVFFSYKLM